ncbi:MAG: class A beta-lactamase [Gemmatimonadetes bacterium]|nr:class A beta-lactamase [Gemmatimonadota bacterium]
MRRGAPVIRGWGVAALASLAPVVSPSALFAQSDPLRPSSAPACVVPDSIHSALRRISRRAAGEVGVAALHIESGTRVALNGERRFPMASVSKVPMALEYLRRVDLGEIDPSESIRVTPQEFRPGHSPLAEWSGGRAVTRSVDSLFSLMLRVSDNTATDVILNMSGGPEAATRRVRELGVMGVEVDRSEARTFADLVGLPDTIPESELYRYQYFRMRDALPQAYRDAARERYGTDPRDTATPNAMVDLLASIQAGAGLSDASRDRLLEVMAASRSGPRRMRGMLPPGTVVAHKTGTMAGAINDVGIITLPGDAGHLVVATFVNTLRVRTRSRERTIAEMTRLLYDYFADAFSGRTAIASGPSPGASCTA